jgi:adenylate kinase
MIIAFLGPPGSGKGTQAKQLKERFGFYHFDTGSMLRREVASGSELGQRIAGFINKGDLVTLDIIKELVMKFLHETEAERIMFDGFPRDLEQARVFDEGLAEVGHQLDCALYLEMDGQTLESRIVNRRTCEICGTIYNMKTNPPKQDRICDRDGGRLLQREDDTPETFRRRLDNYMNKTVPVLEHYRQQGKLCMVNADQPISEVTERIVEALGLHGHGAA